MPAHKTTSYKLIEASLYALKPGESLYVTADLNEVGKMAERLNVRYSAERILIIEDYKTKEPRTIKAVKVTIL